ncbi:MAG: FHA domain-containing protein [Pseudomonadota bacterium]|nr:FHA domain-containing protein [Pseudomonadota bacterium]
MAELLLLRSGEVVHAVQVGEGQVHVGRSPGNELVVSDPTVSGHHLMAWCEGTTIWIKDLASTNGTFLNDRRIRSVHPVRDGDTIRLGTTCLLQVRAEEENARPRARGFVLEDLRAGTRFPLSGDRFSIGSAPDCDLRLADGPDRAATLILHWNGEVRLGTADDEEGPLAANVEFTVGDRVFKVSEVDDVQAATEVPAVERYPYKLSATLEGPFGAEAVLEDVPTRKTHKIDSGNRAVLLFLLGRRFEEDRLRGVPSEERGWCPDDEVMTGVWGRHGDENKLNVLLHRLRAELRVAGFDPWFIEKRQRFVRLRVTEVAIR